MKKQRFLKTLNLDIDCKNVGFYLTKIFAMCLKMYPELENPLQENVKVIITYIGEYKFKDERIDSTYEFMRNMAVLLLYCFS